MKKMITIIIVLIIISACQKKKSWNCTQTFTYPNGKVEVFGNQIFTDITEKEIKIKEKVNTYTNEEETSVFQCQEQK